MSVNFPNSPEDGDIFSGYIFDATKSVWKKLSDLSSSGIDDLNDVTITSPENGQALIYDTSIEEWINQTLVEPVLTLEGLSDTTIEDPLDGQTLVYDSSLDSWVNETPASNLDDLSDVTVSTATTDQLLRWSGTAWVNDTAKTNSIADSAVTASKLATTAGAVMVFDDAAARTTAIPSPIEGMVTYLKDTDKLEKYTTDWVDAAPGTILQVVRATDSTNRSTTSTSFTDVTGMSVTITPTKSTSAIIIISTFFVRTSSSTDANRSLFAITDNSNNGISGAEETYFGTLNLTGASARELRSGAVLIGYDTPGTTSAITYKLRFASVVSTTTTNVDNGVNTGQMYAIEVAA
jgi:hypothetical protein